MNRLNQENGQTLFQNPAFGRDDSIGDLGTFYRECENIPELIMFEEHKRTETEETLVNSCFAIGKPKTLYNSDMVLYIFYGSYY